MGLLDSFFGKKNTESAKTDLPYSMRDTLFGDMLFDQFLTHNQTAEAPPWSIFMEARDHLAANNKAMAIACWQSIVNDPAQEPRCHLQAWHFLNQHGVQPAPEKAKQLLGVVLEVTMPGGLDLLAAYPDHTARYYNFSGGAIIWEHPDTSLDAHIDQLLEASRQVVERIGPWDKPRPGPPGKDEVRLNFLTPQRPPLRPGSHGGPLQRLHGRPHHPHRRRLDERDDREGLEELASYPIMEVAAASWAAPDLWRSRRPNEKLRTITLRRSLEVPAPSGLCGSSPPMESVGGFESLCSKPSVPSA